MLAKIAFGGDLHKRPKDISTIEGYVAAITQVEKSILELIDDKGITHFISIGDWYDKGYASDVSCALSHYDSDSLLAKKLDGNFYGVIGNHIRLNLDSNPELHLIQPHPVFKSRRKTERTEQLLRTPNSLFIGDVQISFVHFDKNEKEDPLVYCTERVPGVKYHIALYHTHAVVPNSKLAGTVNSYNTTPSSKIAQILNGVDLAIVGDVHTPIGKFNIDIGNGTMCTMIVPGSLTNTNSSESQVHSMVDMPIITIEDDSTVKLEFVPFNIFTNLITFKNSTVAKATEKIKSLKGNNVSALNGDVESNILVRAAANVGSWNAFMLANEYTDIDKKMIRAVMETPEDLSRVISIYNEGVLGNV